MVPNVTLAITKKLPKLVAALLLILCAACGLFSSNTARAQADDDLLSRERIWNDPDIPVLGNAGGDLTVVEYFDYQCPICKAVHPGLSRAIREDGKVRLISRGWPIFGGASVYAARIVLAAQYQGRFAQAHEALFTAKVPLTEASIHTLLSKADVDLTKAADDLETHRKIIDAVLTRNQVQAVGLGFLGTPAFIVGPYRVSGGLDAAGFKKALADARAKDKR
jgi:protein-disulfide isomerase